MADDLTPITSPYVWETGDYLGRLIRITVTFNNTTRALTGGSVFRDAACLYQKIYIGTGPDGTPNSTNKAIPVPAGTTNVTANQLKQVGLNVIEDVLALQITAGP
jgi:hypothetical protein